MQLRNVIVMLVFAILVLGAWLAVQDLGKGGAVMPNAWPKLVKDDVQRLELAIKGGEGRVKVGDSEWIARGPDARSPR